MNKNILFLIVLIAPTANYSAQPPHILLAQHRNQRGDDQSPDQRLAQAIRNNDLQAAQEALQQGAQLSHEQVSRGIPREIFALIIKFQTKQEEDGKS